MAQKKEIPLSLQTSVTSLIDPPRKVPGLLHSRPLFRMVPNLHVVQGTPATVRVPRAQTLPTSCVLFTGFHGDPGDLVERGRSTVRSNSDTSLAYNLPTPALSLLLEETLGVVGIGGLDVLIFRLAQAGTAKRNVFLSGRPRLLALPELEAKPPASALLRSS